MPKILNANLHAASKLLAIVKSFFLTYAIPIGLTIFIILLFLSIKAHAAPIDEKLLTAEPSYYKKLIDNLHASGSNKENILLQKTLLKKLLYFSTQNSKDSIPVPIPSNKKQYLELFKKYMAWSENRSNIQNKIDEIAANLKILKNQIKSLPEKDPNLFTLQLQYAFYTKELQFYKTNLSALSKAMAQTPQVLVKALPNISIDIKNIPRELQKIDSSIEKLEATIQAKRIKAERLSLLEKNDTVKQLKEAIKNLQEQKRLLLLKRINVLFLKFSYELKNKKKEVFKTGSEIVKLAALIQQKTALSNDLALLLDNMETLVLGKARTFHGQTIQELKLLLAKIKKTITAPIFTINGAPVSLLKLVIALIVFILGFLAGNFYKKNIHSLNLSSKTLTPATRTLLANLGYYAIVTFSFLMALKVVGIDLSSFALVAGALSVGIGFGLQNIVSNLVSGIILMFERSVKIGDYIEFDEKLRGRVTNMRMRSMTITTNANIDVIVPNQDFIQHRVINWTMHDQIRRFDIPFGVAYGTDPNKVIEVVMTAVTHSGFNELYTSLRRKPAVIMVGMGESSIDFYLRIWIKGSDIMHPKRILSKYLILIYNALYENGIEIPFPQRDIHLRSVKSEIPVIIKEEVNHNQD